MGVGSTCETRANELMRDDLVVIHDEVAGTCFDLTHAKHDPAHCMAPGLFRSLKRGERRKLKLDVAYEFGPTERIEFKGPEPLGVDDLRVLQGLIAMAGPRGMILGPEPKTEQMSEAARQLRLLLEPRWAAAEADSLVVQSSYRALAREIGYESVEDPRRLRACLERLYAVTVFVQCGSKRQGYRVLACYRSDDATGRMLIALNPRITEAVLGRRPHTRIELGEVRNLKSDIARLVHQRLCGWIDPGACGQVALETLMTYAWPDPVPTGKTSALRMRRARLRKALGELERVGWTLAEYARGKYQVTRPTA